MSQLWEREIIEILEKKNRRRSVRWRSGILKGVIGLAIVVAAISCGKYEPFVGMTEQKAAETPGTLTLRPTLTPDYNYIRVRPVPFVSPVPVPIRPPEPQYRGEVK